MNQLRFVRVKTIDDLPPEMLQEVLRPLSLLDLVKCKLVCKRWNELISRMKIERLFVDADLETNERWYYTNRPTKSCDVCCPELFVAQYKQAILSNLRYLRLDYESWNNDSKQLKVLRFDPNALNAFKQLIQLDIDHYEAGELHLKLPNLEILSLNWYHNTNPVSVDCPKLTIMGFCELAENDNLRMENIDRIRYLDSPILGAKLARFRNLEVLRCTEYDQGLLDRSTLLNLKQLKVIYCGIGFGNYDTSSDFRDLHRRLCEFMRLKRVLGRKELRVYFAGLLLVDEDLGDIDFGLEVREGRDFISPEQLYMKHYHRLQDELDFVVNVDYSRLFSLVDVLPDDYFRRFLNLKGVKAFCPLNETHFLAFLRQIYSLEWFSIYNSNLSQEFFECLPELCSLTNFYLFETDESGRSPENEPAKKELQLDFSFIGKFRRLCFVMIERDLSWLSLRTFVAAFAPLRNMFENAWPFRFRGASFKIWKTAHSYSLMTSKNETLLEAVSLREIVDYLELPADQPQNKFSECNQVKRFRTM